MATRYDDYGLPIVDSGPGYAQPNDPNREFFGEVSRETIQRDRERVEGKVRDALGRTPDREPYAFDETALALHEDDRELCGLPPLTPEQRYSRAMAVQGGFIPDLPSGWVAKNMPEEQRLRLRRGYRVTSRRANKHYR